MTQEDKNLLMKDLCARLPYDVKCLVNYTFCVKSSTVDTLIAINQQTENYFFDWLCEWFNVDAFKPYLFPLSSMTEEQINELESLMEVTTVPYFGEVLSPTPKYYDWLDKNKFDYRGLIPMGLAIDATDLNIY